MKYLLILVAALSVLCIISCDLGERSTRTYQLVNGTNRSLRLEFFQYESLKLVVSKSGEGVIYEGTSNDGLGNVINAGEAMNADSIVVIFDNEKIQIYHGDIVTSTPLTDHNPFLEGGYVVVNNRLYRFTFTEADYENAAFVEN